MTIAQGHIVERIDFALNYEISDLKKEIVSIYRNTNINVAILILYKLYTDPREVKTDHAGIAHSLARYILENEKRTAYAKYITDVSLEYNANDLPLMLLKTEIAIEQKDDLVAKETLGRIMNLDPKNTKAKELLLLIEKK